MNIFKILYIFIFCFLLTFSFRTYAKAKIVNKSNKMFTNTQINETNFSNTTVSATTNITTSEEDFSKYAGEFFGVKVPMENYLFVKSTVSRFGNRWGINPTTEQEREDAIWEQLLLSFVAFNQNITVSEEEVNNSITELLRSQNVGFDFKTDKEAYKKWVEEKLKEPVELFENQIKHLTQIEKLYNKLLETVQPNIEDEEVYKQFLNENSSLNLELAKFETEDEADEFYKKAISKSAFWESEKKKNPKKFSTTGLVSVIFLIDIWGIPQNILHRILKRKISDIYPPRKIDKDYVVFKILDKRVANLADFKDGKDGSLTNLIARKKQELVRELIRKLKVEANIKIYKNKEVR